MTTRALCIIVCAAVFLSAGCETKKEIMMELEKFKQDLLSPVTPDNDLTGMLSHEAALDLNGDSTVDGSEISMNSRNLEKTLFERIDRNVDNQLTEGELRAARTSMQGAIIYSEMDADKDGALTSAEFNDFNDRIIKAIMGQYDTDGNSVITRKEFVNGLRAMLLGADANNNNAVSKEELSAESAKVPRSYDMAKGHPIFVMLCDARCVWMSPGTGGGLTGPTYCEQNPGGSVCPSSTHPGCTNGQVADGNCVCPYPDVCMPFF